MAEAKHPPLYYATYEGPDAHVFVGDGPARRGYTAGSQTQIGKEDADRIRKLVKRKGVEHGFQLERVPVALIGTAEETQPTDPAEAIKLHTKLAGLER